MTKEQYTKWIEEFIKQLDKEELEMVFEIVQRIYLSKD